MRSHIDTIVDRNDVHDVGALSSICVCVSSQIYPPLGPHGGGGGGRSARAPGPSTGGPSLEATALTLAVQAHPAPRRADPGLGIL